MFLLSKCVFVKIKTFKKYIDNIPHKALELRSSGFILIYIEVGRVVDVLNVFKKILGLILVFVVAVAFSACGSRVDNTWVVKSEGVNLPEGIYKYYLRESYKKAEEILQDEITDLENGTENPKPLGERKILDMNFNDWVKKETMESCKDLLAVESLFKEEKLSLTDEESVQVNRESEELWSTLSGSFEKFSISKDDVKRAYVEFEIKSKKLFDYYYLEGRNGMKKVTDDEILDYYKSDYVSYSTFTKYAFFSSKSAEGGDDSIVTKGQIDDARNQVQEYVRQINSGEKSFFDVVNSFKEHEDLQSDVVQTETINLKNVDVSDDILNKLKNLDVGKADYVELGDSFILLFKNDISGNLPDLSNENVREDILKNMKYDEFKGILDSAANKLGVQENSEYIKSFVPSDLFKNE